MENLNSEIICTKYPERYVWKNDIQGIKVISIPWIITMFIGSLIFYLVERLSWIWVIIFSIFWVSVIIWALYFLVIFYHKILRLKRRICYDFANKKLLVMRKRDGKLILDIDMKDIKKVITSPYEDDITLIVSDKQITP